MSALLEPFYPCLSCIVTFAVQLMFNLIYVSAKLANKLPTIIGVSVFLGFINARKFYSSFPLCAWDRYWIRSADTELHDRHLLQHDHRLGNILSLRLVHQHHRSAVGRL